jgi:hypothetical protein
LPWLLGREGGGFEDDDAIGRDACAFGG